MTLLCKLDVAFSRIEEAFIGVLLIAASFILFANVVARYGFNDSFPWAEELTRYAIVWMVFVGGSLAARKGAHISVDVLWRVLGDHPARKVLVVSVDFLCVLFSLFLVVYGWDLVAQAREFGQVTPSLQVPLWTVQLAIPVSGVLMAVRFTQHLFAEISGRAKKSSIEILG